MPKQYLLIGASAASMGALHKLRQLDPHAQITIFSAEKEDPYNKCFLADFLAGITTHERLQIYRGSPQVSLQLDTRITAIDPEAKMITTHKGLRHSYDALFLGMGSGPWVPNIPGVTGPGVFTFHTLADMLAIQEYIKKFSCKTAIICGAGLSGLEAADALRAQGIGITIVEKSAQVLPHLLDQGAARFLHEHMRSMDVNLICEQSLFAIEHEGQKPIGVRLSNDTFLSADIVIMTTGLRANTQLCESAGITTGHHGVVVNEYMQTNQPNIFAGGDLIQVTDTLTGTLMRSCMWPDAMQQGMYAAQAMIGQPRPYPGAAIIVSSAFFGLKFARAGAFSGEVNVAQGATFYHQINQERGVLQGFQVLGTRHDLGLLRRLILTKQPLIDSLNSLFEL